VQALTMANLALAATLVLVLVRAGGDRRSLRDRSLTIAAMALVVRLVQTLSRLAGSTPPRWV
jgi:hypothetical protein